MTSGAEPFKIEPILQKGGDFLKLIAQIGLIFGLCWISQCIEHILPFPFPASVISLLLLLVLLLARAVKVERVKDLADFLLGNLAFFFVPAVAGVMNYVDVLKESLVPFLVICVVSTVLTFGAAAWAVQLTVRLLEKRKEAKK